MFSTTLAKFYRTCFTASISLLILSTAAFGQTNQDAVLKKLNTLRDDYVARIKAAGFTPRLSPPKIILDNPRSFGKFDDEANVLHTCDWHTLPQPGKDYFNGFAAQLGQGLTGEKFFDLAVHQWIFIHELGHWWRACQQVTAPPYQNEKAANRLDAAYWSEKSPEFYRFMLLVFQSVVNHGPSPVPAGRDKEKYLNDNYDKLPGGAAYSWYQSIMIIEVSKEKPFETFRESVKLAGKPLTR
jgi:hypothetical protein